MEHLSFAVRTTGNILIAINYFEERDLRNQPVKVYVNYQKISAYVFTFREI